MPAAVLELPDGLLEDLAVRAELLEDPDRRPYSWDLEPS